MIFCLFLYLIVLVSRQLAIGSAYSLRTIISILPLLAFPFIHWYKNHKKFLLIDSLFILLVSFSIFINILAASARVHFWHFNIYDATKGALVDLFKWNEYNIITVDLQNSNKDNITFDHNYFNTLHPSFYDKQAKFDIDIDFSNLNISKTYIEIQFYVIYPNNYVKLYINGKRICYLKGQDKEIKKTISVDITDFLNTNNDNITVSGLLYSNSDTSVELYDTRIENISVYYR